MINDLMSFRYAIAPTSDPRAVLGKSNEIQGFGKMNADLQKTVGQIGGYILGQQYPILREMVTYESLIVNLPSSYSEIQMPTRYLCRVGELLMIPLRGSVTMYSREFNDPVTMTDGNIYRINNRVDSSFNSSPDFLAVCFNYLDFDLKRYLMLHDIMSPFARREDEYVDPSKAQPSLEAPQDAY
jgi:hypothetical protein